MFIRRWLIGIPLATVQASGERLSKVVALAVFSSDALSSVAHATEEMLLVLVLAGSLALGWSIPLSLAITLLLVILTMSYRHCEMATRKPLIFAGHQQQNWAPRGFFHKL